MFIARCTLTFPDRLAVANGRFEFDYEHGGWHKSDPKTCHFVPLFTAKCRPFFGCRGLECTCEFFDSRQLIARYGFLT